MVLTPTVIVTGAGASMSYGFPSGASLTKTIVNELLTREIPVMSGGNVTHVGLKGFIQRVCPSFTPWTLQSFAERLKNCPVDSIDAFVYPDANREFVNAAKVAVAWHLQAVEEEKKCQPTDNEDDWLRYVFRRLITGARRPEDLAANRLTIVTFNFDRVIEYRWMEALRLMFDIGGSELEAAHATLRVVHVHGAILDDLTPSGFQRAPIGTRLTEQVATAAMGRINFIHDDTEPVEEAHSALEQASRVIFLGLSYADLNLDRLGIPRTLGRSPAGMPAPHVFGSCLGLPAGDVKHVENRLRPQPFREPNLVNAKSLGVLLETGALLDG